MSDNFTDYDDDFAAAPEPVRGGTVPDGDYIAELTALGTKYFEDGNMRLEYTFKITEGDCAGLRIWKNETIPAKGSNEPKDVTKRGYLMLDAKIVSNNPNIKFSEYLAGLSGFEGQVFKIHAKKNGKYTNVNINERVAFAAAPAAPPVAPAPAQQPALPGIPANNGSPWG